VDAPREDQHHDTDWDEAAAALWGEVEPVSFEFHDVVVYSGDYELILVRGFDSETHILNFVVNQAVPNGMFFGVLEQLEGLVRKTAYAVRLFPDHPIQWCRDYPHPGIGDSVRVDNELLFIDPVFDASEDPGFYGCTVYRSRWVWGRTLFEAGDESFYEEVERLGSSGVQGWCEAFREQHPVPRDATGCLPELPATRSADNIGGCT